MNFRSESELFEIAEESDLELAGADLEEKNVSTYIVQVADKSSEQRTLRFDVGRKIRSIVSAARLSFLRPAIRDETRFRPRKKTSRRRIKRNLMEASVETSN